MTHGPPERVLQAFGAAGPPSPLPGGAGTSWRAGELVLKPAGDGERATLAWLDAAAPALVQRERIRLALPLRSRDGSLIVEGWAATRRLAGAVPVGRWAERAAVARQLARTFGPLDPRTLPPRDDPWARADRIAWGEDDGPLRDHPLAAVRTVGTPPAAVVHGDLAGNTLLHPGLPPAVIDLSLYARPVEWSVAVLCIDGVGFGGAPTGLLATASADPSFPGYLARALLFRMVTDVLLGRPVDPAYRALVDPVLALAG
ncbi:MAG TPA: TIGR02569 family protein [Amnibacterium sp.]|nr:TIGR02569 family protein [Amnibacterium sp.]